MKKSKLHLWIGLFLFLVVLFFYLVFLCPTIHTRDNPDVITAAATLGIAHPPGYPLFTILGFLATKIPIGSIPYRVNLMSALFSAMTIALVYLIILKMTRKILPSLIAAAILAFSYYYFLQSLYADFLSLNNLLMVLEILVLLIWAETKKSQYLWLFAFLLGLAFSSHQMSFIIFPALIYFLVATDKKVFAGWNVPKMIGLFALGLLPFIYLPIRALEHPAYMWGDPSTWHGFWAMITRQEYARSGNFQYFNYSLARVWDWLKLITFKEFYVVGFLLGIIGLVGYWKKDKKIAIFILSMIILSGPVFAFFSDVPTDWVERIMMERFFIVSFTMFTLAIGLGIDLIFEKYQKWAYFALLLPVGFLIINAPQVNLRHYYYAYDLGRNILKDLPPNAVIFAGSDVPLFELQYLQKVEHFRTDVKVIPGADPKLVGLPPSTTEQIKKEFPDYDLSLDDLAKKYPVYTTNDIDIFWGSKTNNFIPEGLVYRYTADSNWAKNFNGLTALKNLKNDQTRGSYQLAQAHDLFTHEVIYYYVYAWTSLGQGYQKSGHPADGAFCYEKALAIDPTYIVALNNYAGTFLERGDYASAIAKFKEILNKYPGLSSATNGLSLAEQGLSNQQKTK